MLYLIWPFKKNPINVTKSYSCALRWTKYLSFLNICVTAD